MSRLSNLLKQVELKDPTLAADLAREVKALGERREFGLNFERHTPETVELPGRPVRKGDKVRFLAERGSPKAVDPAIWRVVGVTRTAAGQVASLRRRNEGAGAVQTAERLCADLVVIAEFRDPIYPGLVSTGRQVGGGDKPFHAVINAENYHALQTLLYTHENKVDAIYIDPPYNTGSKDWKYNNHFVDGDDLYRHSKWLAFMERRLRLAKRLMNPSRSVLILTIDENEVHRVALLLQQIFKDSKVQMVTALINPAGASIIDQFSRVDEHILFVHVGSARPDRTIIDTTPGSSTFINDNGEAKPFQWEGFQRRGGNSRREDTKAKFFPVFIDEAAGCIVGCGDHLPEEVPISEAKVVPPKGAIAQWPIKQDGSEACWQLSAPTFREYLSAGRIKIGRRNSKTGRWGISFLTKGHMKAIADGELVVGGRDANGSLIVTNAEGRIRTQVGKTIWTNGSYSATEHGSTLLRSFIPGRKFPFPKSLYAVEDALRFYIGSNPNAIVLDFFAGSGTTTHAVARLNRQDGGRRQSICVTNNEVSAVEQVQLRKKGLRPADPDWEAQGICEFITKPRLIAAFTGVDCEGKQIEGAYRFTDPFPMAEGFDENVEFFKLTYESPRSVAHNRSFAAVAPLLWLKAGAQGSRIDQAAADYAIADVYGVLFDLDHSAEFLTAVAEHPRVRMAFVVTDDDRAFQMVCGDLSPHVEPVRLYESYLNNFEINTGRGDEA